MLTDIERLIIATDLLDEYQFNEYLKQCRQFEVPTECKCKDCNLVDIVENCPYWKK